ncbi:hypothetical protein, partial [Thiolapillus sp.]|uniref:hypothetical protein n=1 Tax=Thiolapillus sp. TaxID=2017437 RepID=UPI003AF86E4E
FGTAVGCLSLGRVMTKDWIHGVGHSPVCQILLQIVVRAVITSSPPAWTSSAGMLSTPADFPFFNDCTAASTSLRRMGWSFSVSVWVQFSTDGSPLALWLYSSEQYSDDDDDDASGSKREKNKENKREQTTSTAHGSETGKEP